MEVGSGPGEPCAFITSLPLAVIAATPFGARAAAMLLTIASLSFRGTTLRVFRLVILSKAPTGIWLADK